MASATQFGREYMAFSDGLMGQDLPRQYDDTNFDRVSQIGPAEGPAVADATATGNISPGVHQCVGDFRDAPRLLDRAFAAGFVDGRGRKASERHEYSHGAVERGAAAAGVYRQRRRDVLSSARAR